MKFQSLIGQLQIIQSQISEHCFLCFNPLQVSYKWLNNALQPGNKNDCFNPLQVSYKSAMKYTGHKSDWVSIPYRLATNWRYDSILLQFSCSFQSLIGQLQIFLNSKGTKSNERVSIPYRLATNRLYCWFISSFYYVSIPYRLATNFPDEQQHAQYENSFNPLQVSYK